jgi:CP family cyanate transporter-like MFS transporter
MSRPPTAKTDQADRTGAGPAANPVGLAAVFLVAACLRPAITSVGPLLDLVGSDTGLSNTLLGLLSSLPLLAFAAVSPLVQGRARRFGAERLIVWALAGLTFGIAVRSLPNLATLWLGTLVLGAAIAIGNVLLPAVVRRDHAARAALVIGWYSAVLGTAAAIASGLALPIASAIGDGWRWSLAVWAVPAAAATVIWWRRSRPVPRPARPERGAVAADAASGPSVWRSALAWRCTAYMGLQSTSFYILVSWLPAIMTARHQSHAAAGWYLFAYQVVGIGAGLLAPLVLHRLDRDVTAALASLPMIVACVGLIAAPRVPAVWVTLAGISSGSALVIALSLFSLNADSPAHAAQLSGMGQSLGYLLAAGGPVAAGWLRDATGSWSPALVGVAVLTGVQALVTLAHRRPGRPAGQASARSRE